MKEIARGAEAVISKEGEKIVKERVKKGYRLEQIDDSLRKKRTRTEAKLLNEARRAGVATPQVLEANESRLEMQLIGGEKVRDILDEKNAEKICIDIGTSIGKLHSFDIIHGDLTTSNMILSDDRVFFIDFGLGFFSQRIEDKAVDLHLLRQALDSTHFDLAEKAWEIILKAYLANCSQSEAVLKALQNIEKRGRYAKR